MRIYRSTARDRLGRKLLILPGLFLYQYTRLRTHRPLLLRQIYIAPWNDFNRGVRVS